MNATPIDMDELHRRLMASLRAEFPEGGWASDDFMFRVRQTARERLAELLAEHGVDSIQHWHVETEVDNGVLRVRVLYSPPAPETPTPLDPWKATTPPLAPMSVERAARIMRLIVAVSMAYRMGRDIDLDHEDVRELRAVPLIDQLEAARVCDAFHDAQRAAQEARVAAGQPAGSTSIIVTADPRLIAALYVAMNYDPPVVACRLGDARIVLVTDRRSLRTDPDDE